MQDNIKDLHTALISDGHYTVDDLGDEKEFREYVSKPENARAFHKAVLSDGHYKEADLGNEDEFMKYVGAVEAPQQTAAQVQSVETPQQTAAQVQQTAAGQSGATRRTVEEPGFFEGMFGGAGQSVMNAGMAAAQGMNEVPQGYNPTNAEPRMGNENILSAEEEAQMIQNTAQTGQPNPTREERNAAQPKMMPVKGITEESAEERFSTPASNYAKETVFNMRGDEAQRKAIEEQPFYTNADYVEWLGKHPGGTKEQFEEQLKQMPYARRVDVENDNIQKLVKDTTIGEQLGSIITQTVDNAWKMRGVVGLEPQKLSKEIASYINQTPMTVEFMTKIYDEAQKLDIPFTEYLQKTKGAIVQAAQEQAMAALQEKMLPKDDIEYILNGVGESTVAHFVRGMMFNPEFNRMQDEANMMYGQGVQQRWEDTIANNIDNENLRKALTLTNPTELGRITVSFVPELLPMGGVGKLTGMAAKKLVETKVARLVALGMKPENAARVVGLATSKGQQLATTTAMGAVNFGGYNVVSEIARQYELGEDDAAKVAEEGLKGLVLGGAIGIISKGVQMATQSASGATRLAGMVGSFLAEDAVFTGAEEAQKWAEGRTEDINLVEDFARGALTLGAMKLSNPAGLKESLGNVAKALKGESGTTDGFNATEREQFENSSSCKDLVRAVNKAMSVTIPEMGEMSTGKELAGYIGGKGAGVAGKVADSMRSEIEEAYRMVILDPTLDYSLKCKVALAFKGSMPAGVPRPTSYTADDETRTVKTRDERGFVIKTYKAATHEDYVKAKDDAMRNVVFGDALRDGNQLGVEVVNQMIQDTDVTAGDIVRAIQAYLKGEATEGQIGIANEFGQRYMEIVKAMRTDEAGRPAGEIGGEVATEPYDIKQISDQSGATRRTVEEGAGEAPAEAQPLTAANGGGETAGNAALANGGAADADLSPAERLAKGIGERVTQQQERGRKVVQDGGVGAADLQTEYDTAVARVARAFAEGSQNAAVAADVQGMADSGRAQAAYQYLNDKKGELTDYQYKALEQYIDAQTAVMSMEIGIGDAVESAVRVRDTMMSVLTNEDGRIQQVEVLPMGDGSGGGMAFIKSGSMTNQYANTVQVRYVTIDGNGTLWPGETVQIAKSRIKQGSVTEAVPYDMYMEDYRKQVSAQMAAEWQQKRAGLGYNIGDVVQVRIGNTDATAVIKGTDGGGNIVIADANEPDNQMLWTAIPKAQLDQMIQTARQNKVAATLTAEASQQIAEQKRQKIQAQEQRRAADIVGYTTGGLLTTQGGRIDIAHKDTKAATAAAYLVENQGGNNAKAVSWVEGEKMQLAQRQEQLIEQQRELNQWMGAYGGRGETDESRVAGQLESINAQLNEINQRYDKLNEIRYHVMTPEMRQQFMAERNKFILDAKKTAAAKAAERAPKKVVKDRYGRDLDEEGEVKISSLEKNDAAQFLLDNYETEMDAHSHLEYLFDGLQRQLRQVNDNLARHGSSYQAFREGRTDLEATDLKTIAEAEERLTRQRNELMTEMAAINKLDKQLEKIYRERNEALDAADPTKGRVDRIMRKSTPEGRLRQAEKEYEQYPEALTALENGTEPQTIEEYVSQIGPGSLNFEDMYVGESKVIGLQSAIGKNMTRTRGVGRNRVAGDTVGFDYVLTQKPEQGKGFQEVVHKLWEGRPVEAWSDQDIANALIDVLMSVSKPEELRFMVVNNRIAEAEAAASHQDQEEERMRDEAEYKRQQEMLYGGSDSAGEPLNTNGSAAVETAANGGRAAEAPLGTEGSAAVVTAANGGSAAEAPLGTEGSAAVETAANGGDVDPFTSGEYDPFDFALGDNEENTEVTAHNAEVKKHGGLVANMGAGLLDDATANLIGFIGRKLGKTYQVKFARQIYNELPEKQKARFKGGWRQIAQGALGYTNHKTGEVVLVGEALLKSPTAAAQWIAGHETTHVLRKLNNPELWDAYQKAVRAAMGEDAWKAEIERLGGVYTEPNDNIVEEVCANFAGDHIFAGKDAAQKFVDSMAEQGVDVTDFASAVVEFLKWMNEFAKRIKAMKQLDGEMAATYEEMAENAMEVWEAMFEQAAEKVEVQKAAEAVDGGADWALVTDAKEIEAFDRAPKKVQYRTMQVVDGLLYPPMAMVTGKGKEKKRQDGLRLGDLFKADENPDLAKPVMDKKTGEQKVNEKTGKPQYTFKLDKGGKDDFGEKLTDVNAAYNPYVHTSNSPINDQLSTSYKRSNMVVVKGEISLDDIGSGYWADKAHDSVGEKDWKLGSVSTALEKAGRIARKVTLSQYFRPTEIVPVSEVADFYAGQLEGTGIEVPFNTVTPELREALVERGVAIGEPENSNAGEAARPYYEEWKKSAAVETAANGGTETAGKAAGTVAVGAAEAPLANKKGDNGLFGYFTGTLHELYELSKEQGNKLVKKILAPIKDRLINELKAKGLELTPNYKHTIDNYAINHIIKSHSDKKEEERGQIPVTEEDIAKINDIVENFNEVAYFDGRQPTRIIYRKSMPDGTTLFVEEVRKGRKELAAVSMRKYKNSNLTIEDLKIPTSNTPEATMDLDAVSKAQDEIKVLRSHRGTPINSQELFDAAKVIQNFELPKKNAGNIENNAQNGENVQGNQQKNKWKKEEEIIGELSEPTQSESASNPSKPQTPNNSGKEPLNAKGQLSGGKGTENFGNDQINQQENAENQQKTADDDVQWALDVSESAPWLSNAAEGLRKIKQEKATGEQWVKMLQKNGGLKAEEDKWIGLSDFLLGGDIKEKQAEIINRSNPKDESLSDHTWITSADDILTFEEAVNDEWMGTPDFTEEDAKKALQTGKVKVYSSYPIKNGVFVTPSRMEAEAYAGGEKVHEKVVNIKDVAWLDSNQGQMAVVDKMFTKAQVRRFIEENAVRIEDVEYAEGASEDDLYEVISPYQDEFAEIYENALESNDSEDAYNVAWDEMCDKYPDFNMTFEYLPQAPDYLSLHREDGKLRPEAMRMLGMDDSKPIDSTRLSYTTTGLRNNREIALVVPGIEPYDQNDNIHFGDAGEGRAVAWVRFGDAETKEANPLYEQLKAEAEAEEIKDEPDYDKIGELGEKMSEALTNKPVGRKVLVMDEVQSKRHQDGREDGYQTISTEKAYALQDEFSKKMSEKYSTQNFFPKMTEEERAEWNRLEEQVRNSGGVPDAPFRKNWHEVGMKRMLRYAAENGYDKLAWTTGKQQAERYGIGEVVKSVIAGYTADGERVCILHTNPITTLHYDDAGKITDASNYEDTLVGRTLTDVLGKELGQKILAIKEGEREVFEGNDLMLGGEGMKGFYDNMVVKFMDKYCKKWGVKTQDVELDLPNEADRVMHSVDITPEMKEEILDGQLMWALVGEIGAKNLDEATKTELTSQDKDERMTNIGNLGVAREMVSRGYDAETIKHATGWEAGADGKWKMETNDLELRYRPDGDAMTMKDVSEDTTLTLGDIVRNDNGLFTAYPELRDVNIDGRVYGSTLGQYNRSTNTVSLNMQDYDRALLSFDDAVRNVEEWKNPTEEAIANAEDFGFTKEQAQANAVRKAYQYANDLASAEKKLSKVLAHEIQHYIQRVEGFAKGGNPGLFEQADTDEKFVLNTTLAEMKGIGYDANKLTIDQLLSAKRDGHANNLWAAMFAYADQMQEPERSNALRFLTRQERNAMDAWSSVGGEKARETYKQSGSNGTYRALAGEVESRTVSDRYGLSTEERYESLASIDDDVEREDQIIMFALSDADTTTAANREAWEKAKYSTTNPKGVILMRDGGGYVTFGADARNVAQALGQTAKDGVLRLNMGDYFKLKDQDAENGIQRDVKTEHWSDWEEYPDAIKDGVWDSNKYTKKNVIQALKGHPELIRLRQAVKGAETQEERKAAVDDYVQTLSDMMDGEREDIKVLTGARAAFLEAISEANEIAEKEGKVTFGIEEQRTTKAKTETKPMTRAEQRKAFNARTTRVGFGKQKFRVNSWKTYGEVEDKVAELKANLDGASEYSRERVERMADTLEKRRQQIAMRIEGTRGSSIANRKQLGTVGKTFGAGGTTSTYRSGYSQDPEFKAEVKRQTDAFIDKRRGERVDEATWKIGTLTGMYGRGKMPDYATVGAQKPAPRDKAVEYPLGGQSVWLTDKEATTVKMQRGSLPKPESAGEPWAHVKKATVHTSNMRRRYPQLWEAAKHGDVKAAYELVKSVVKPSVVMKLAVEHPDAIVAYPHYEDRTRTGENGEIMGTNAIPQAYAETFERFGMIVDNDIMQVNRVSRTDATRYDRLMNRARFKGDVVPGQEYILVDDHITSGATLRDMKDYIESRGGTVVAISALEGSAGSTNIEITDDIINELDKLGVTDEHLQNLGISRSRNSLTAAEAREIIVLAKRGRDFRSKAQKEEHLRATQGDEKARRRARADERAAAAESRRLRERAEAEKRFEDLRRERERFVELFGEMPEGDAVETATNEGAAEAPLATGGRYADVSGVEPAEEGFYDSAGEPLNTNADSWKTQIEAARTAVDANPTDGQKEAGNYKKGHLRLDGFNISLENAKGSTRSGRDADGKEWSVTMHYDYGDIRGRVGVDGDNIDVYLSDKPYEGNVYVVDQVDPKTGKFDEHKVMYGFGSVDEAKEAYLSNYEDGWQGLGDITEVSKELFKEWLESSKKKLKPFAEYVIVKHAKHPDTGLTERGRAEIERIQKEMAAEIEAEAQRYIEDERKRDIEEVYGRYPGGPVSLRDRGITLTDAQRWVFRNQIKRAFELMGRQAELDRYYEKTNEVFRGKKRKVTDPSTGEEHDASILVQTPNVVDFYPGQEIWFPERAPEVDEEFEKLMRPEWISPNAAGNKSDAVETATNKEAETQPLTAVNGGTETAGNAAGTVMPPTTEPEEEPFELTPEETEAERAKRLRREGARRRFWNRLDGKELDAERDDIKDKPAAKKSAAVETAANKAAGNAAGAVTADANPDAGAAVRVEKDGQLAFMESGPDTGVSMTGDDVMELQWALGVNANRPRKKRGESDFAYLARVAAWEAQQERMASLPPAPDQEEIDGRWMSQFESDHAAWLERHGLDGRPLGAQPERGDFESVDDYAEALRQWEQRRDAMADADDPEPIQLDYMVKAQDEYRDAYLQWKRDNDVKDDEDMALGFSTLFTGEVPQPRTVVGTNVETGETVELPADEELAAEVAQSEQVLSEIGAHTGFANTPAGARKAVKIAIIERRKTLESSGAEDAIFLHELKKDMEAIGKELGKKGEELDKMMPFIVEAPTRLAEVIGELYYAARQHPLDHYLIKGALPEIMSGEATDEALINDIRSVVDSALEGGVKQLEDAVRDYNYYRDPRVKPIVDKVQDWYQEFYTLIESKGLRRGAGYVSNYVNHVWSKELSDPKAYETYVRTTSPNMRQRQLSTYAKGVEIGLAPKYEKLTEMMAHYSRQNNEAIANRELLDYLTGLTVDLLNSDGEVVNVLSVLSSEEPNGFIKDKYVRYEVPGVGGVWVLRDVQKRFATIFGQEWNRDANEGENKFWRMYDRTGDLMKSIQLSLSGFHALALTEVALVQKNPLKALGDVMKFTFWDSLRAGTTPPMAHPEEFKDAAAHLVKLGASDDYAAAEVHTMTGKLRKMAQEVYDKQKALGAVPLLTTSLLDWMNKGMDKLLWEYIHDGLKVAAFRGYANSLRAKAKKEGWSERQLDKMLDEAGQYVNDAFGGQYWEVIGMTPSTLRTLRRVLLSPDWFVSTSRHAMSMTGFGSLYAPEGFMDYVTMRNKWGKSDATRRTEEATASDFGQEADEEIGNEGRKFRGKGAWLCYSFLVPVFYGGIMNVLNAAFRKQDEERELEKAEEERKANPEYKSPYELVYPDGMKWYDYTMYGNSEGNNTQLFVGRYDDGTERYIRWGKQFREIPEFFMGRYGVEVPGPLMERMMGKSNPVAGTMLDMLRYYGAGLLNKTPEQKDLEEKYGKHIGALAMVARKFMPFSVPTQEDKEFYWSDLVMPSKKGFSNWRALDAYEHFILAGDMDGIAAVTNACIMNGINAEEKLEAAIKRVEAMQKKERGTSVEDMQGAMNAFEASDNVKDRKTLKKKIAAFMLKEQYRTFTAQDARERVEERLNGTDELSEGITRDQSDKYLLLLRAEDVRDDIRLSKAKKAADAVVKEGKNEAANGDGGAYLRAHGREVRVKTIIGKYNAAINKLKKTLGKGDDEAVMQKIAELRKKALAETEE